jgi:uncharacterized protein (TIGR03435 family)
MRSLHVILLLAAALPAQTPSFEVASIRPSAPPGTLTQNFQGGTLHLGLVIDRARVDIAGLSLAEILPVAYRVKPYQVIGPDWMNEDRWDILGKLPEGASTDRVPEMLQSLLRDRFRLEAHSETRERNVYALVLNKNGPALKPSAPDAPAPRPGAQGNMQPDAKGRTVTITGGPAGTLRATYLDDDSVRVELRANMPALAEILLADRTVIDFTELKGMYDIALVVPQNVEKPMLRSAMGFGMMMRIAGRDDTAALSAGFAKSRPAARIAPHLSRNAGGRPVGEEAHRKLAHYFLFTISLSESLVLSGASH